MVRAIDRITACIDQTLLVVGCFFLAAMMIQITADVVMRSLLDTPVPVTIETVSNYYMVGAIFLPLSYIERRRAHIEVELFTQFMPARAQFVLYLFSCLVGLGFFGVLTYQTFLDAVSATINQETVMSTVIFYIWPSRWALPIGFAAACLAIINNVFAATAKRAVL